MSANLTPNTIGSLDGSSTIIINSSAGHTASPQLFSISVSHRIRFPITTSARSLSRALEQMASEGIFWNTSTSQLETVNNNTIANITETQSRLCGVWYLLSPALCRHGQRRAQYDRQRERCRRYHRGLIISRARQRSRTRIHKISSIR